MNRIKTFIFLSLVFSLTSCSKSLYKTFYVGKEGNQYFVFPLEFEQSNERLEVDFTFLDVPEHKDSVRANFTIYAEQPYLNINQVVLEGRDAYSLSSIKLIFKEKGKTFNTRYTSYMSLADLKSYISSEDPQVVVYQNSQSQIFDSTSKTQSKMEKLTEDLFVLFN